MTGSRRKIHIVEQRSRSPEPSRGVFHQPDQYSASGSRRDYSPQYQIDRPRTFNPAPEESHINDTPTRAPAANSTNMMSSFKGGEVEEWEAFAHPITLADGAPKWQVSGLSLIEGSVMLTIID